MKIGQIVRTNPDGKKTAQPKFMFDVSESLEDHKKLKGAIEAGKNTGEIVAAFLNDQKIVEVHTWECHRGDWSQPCDGEWSCSVSKYEPTGTLKVVYHGTDSDAKFDKFDLSRLGSKLDSKHGQPSAYFGVAFTTDMGMAEWYGADGGRLVTAQVDLKNPYYMTSEEFERFEMEEWDDIRAPHVCDEVRRRQAELIDSGYDGIVVDDYDVVFVFSPEQIRILRSETAQERMDRVKTSLFDTLEDISSGSSTNANTSLDLGLAKIWRARQILAEHKKDFDFEDMPLDMQVMVSALEAIAGSKEWEEPTKVEIEIPDSVLKDFENRQPSSFPALQQREYGGAVDIEHSTQQNSVDGRYSILQIAQGMRFRSWSTYLFDNHSDGFTVFFSPKSARDFVEMNRANDMEKAVERWWGQPLYDSDAGLGDVSNHKSLESSISDGIGALRETVDLLEGQEQRGRRVDGNEINKIAEVIYGPMKGETSCVRVAEWISAIAGEAVEQVRSIQQSMQVADRNRGNRKIPAPVEEAEGYGF